jgi:molecular chaperone DnaK
LRNEAENTYFNTEKQLNEFRAKLSQQEIEEIEGALATLKNFHENKSLTYNDAPKVREAVDKAKNAAMKIGQAMYRNAGGAAGTGDQQQQQQQQQEQPQQEQQQEQQPQQSSSDKKDEPKN